MRAALRHIRVTAPPPQDRTAPPAETNSNPPPPPTTRDLKRRRDASYRDVAYETGSNEDYVGKIAHENNLQRTPTGGAAQTKTLGAAEVDALGNSGESYPPKQADTEPDAVRAAKIEKVGAEIADALDKLRQNIMNFDSGFTQKRPASDDRDGEADFE